MLSAIIQYSPIEPSYVLAAMYQVEPTVIEQRQHASKFADKGREATKQELYKNLLGMGAVRMVKLHNLKKELCINVLTYLMFLKQKKDRKSEGLRMCQ